MTTASPQSPGQAHPYAPPHPHILLGPRRQSGAVPRGGGPVLRSALPPHIARPSQAVRWGTGGRLEDVGKEGGHGCVGLLLLSNECWKVRNGDAIIILIGHNNSQLCDGSALQQAGLCRRQNKAMQVAGQGSAASRALQEAEEGSAASRAL